MTTTEDDDIDAKITALMAKATEKKVVKRQTKIVTEVDLAEVPDVKKTVDALTKEGFSTPQIASALGFDEGRISLLLEEKTDLDSDEHMLQTNLMRLHALVPLADSTYRGDPNHRNAQALTGIIDSVTKIITELHALKDKEEVYGVIVQKVVQPLVRAMAYDIVSQFKELTKNLQENPEQNDKHLAEAALAIGKKLDEGYRKCNETLAQVIGLNSEAKVRVLARLAMNGD